jgi:ADP-ribose pyrophosphatase
MPDAPKPALSKEPKAKKSLCRGKFLELVSAGGWEFVDRVRGRTPVGIVALTPDDRVLLISQHRVPVDADVIEIPAGLVGDHDEPGGVEESWEVAAGRELVEETGWEAGHVEQLSLGPTSAGLTSECILLVRATALKKVGEPQSDGSENITVHAVPLVEIDAWLDAKAKAGMLIDPKVFAALYFLRRPTEV